MAGLLKSIDRPSVLLVEGKTGEWFFRSLLEHLGHDGTQIVDFGGVSQLAGMIARVGTDPRFRLTGRRLAIVRDAEKDAPGAFQSVAHALVKSGLTAPAAPGSWTEDALSIGVFILPDNLGPGMIETLCLSAENAARRECVGQFAACMAAQGAPAAGDKETMQALLAIAGVGNPQVGAAARQSYFDWASPSFAALRAFVSELE